MYIYCIYTDIYIYFQSGIGFLYYTGGILNKPADHLSEGLPWGAVGLPGCQIPPRAERSDGLAARRDPDPTVDVLLHPTLLRTCGETAAADRERGEARGHELWKVKFTCFHFFCRSLFQLLQAFYRQQDEIRGLKEELDHKDVSIPTQSHTRSQNT